MSEVRKLFDDVQPGPAEGDVGTTFIEVARTISQVCATRMLLMIAVVTGAGIWSFTVYQPTQDRLWAAIAFSLVLVLPLIGLYWKRG